MRAPGRKLEVSMALELRLQQKMAQQLVMTPQLQQAIKLLQLSHLDLAEAIQDEMEQNPILEDSSQDGTDRGDEAPSMEQELTPATGDTGLDASDTLPTANASNASSDAPEPQAAPPSEGDTPGVADGATVDPATGEIHDDMTRVLDAPLDATPEPSDREVEREIDWDAYFDTYSYSLPSGVGAAAAGEELPSYEATVSSPTSLADHLRWQVHMSEMSEHEAQLADLIIEELDDQGYVPADVITTVADEADAVPDAVEAVLRQLQTFDPPGVCARSLRECLLTQVRALSHPEPVAEAIIDGHLDQLKRRNYQAIARAVGASIDDVGEAVQVISTLEPRPGRSFATRPPQYITPDIYVHKVGDKWEVAVNDDGLPRLRISNYYRQAMHGSNAQTRQYIQDKLRSAAWLIRSIHMRQRTIHRVMKSILKFQEDFFNKGVAFLKPLVLKDVAADVEMHESTISRVTNNKYVHTPQGIFELKYFFNPSIGRGDGSSVASESVREHIRQLVANENPKAPLSDQKLAKMLKDARNIDIARRTIAKYREQLGIPSSSQRRRVF